MSRWWVVLCLALVFPGGLVAQEKAAEEGDPQGEYVIGVGDRIRISYSQGVSFDDPGKMVEVMVPAGSDGKVLIPLVGKVTVVGRSPKEIEDALRRELSRYVEDPQVYVEVLDYQSLTGILLGATIQQGVFPLLPNTTVAQFISSNGGITPAADLSRVSVLRQDGELVLLDLEGFFVRGVVTQDILMQPGDRVFVPQRDVGLLERTVRVVQLVGLVLQSVILVVVLSN